MGTRVWFTSMLSSSVDVSDAEIAEYAQENQLEVEEVDVLDIAYAKFPAPRICAQCGGWGRPDDEFMDQGEWEADDEVEEYDES